MNTCPNCGMVKGMHGSILPGCMCPLTPNGNALTIAYQSGYYDGKKAALAGLEQNFCPRCGKRTADLTVIHTCTPPQKKK